MRSSDLLRSLALAAALLAAAPAMAASANQPPLSAFFNNPDFGDVALSPSGKYLAVHIGGKNQQRDMLGVVDLTSNQTKIVGNFADADIGSFAWVNDERLTFTATDRDLAPGDRRFAPGLYAVNRDGSGFRQLAMRNGKQFITVNNGGQSQRDLLPWHTYMLDQDGAQDSESVYLEDRAISGPGQLDHVDLLRVNTLTGRVTAVVPRPGESRSWLLDASGEPRLTTTLEKGVSSLYYRDPDSKQWRQLLSYEAYTNQGMRFRPIGFGPDGTLYVVSWNNSDTSALYAYDVKNNKLADHPLVKLEGYDFRGELIIGHGKLLGVRYVADSADTTWFDADMKAMQASVDHMLPNTTNLLTLPSRPQTPWVLVTAYSDVWPKRVMLYNSETKKLQMVGAERPEIDPNQMGHRVQVRYKARDGLEIPAWLTLPNGQSKNLPLIMLVHGGPYLRGSGWAWKADAEFLASRGYAVLEPEFRGSTGFGIKHFTSGWKQWGLKMQDDVADGARWAIGQGVADAKRICIAGASYGGYATLMGLVNDPDLYKCGVEWAGVTDINLLYDGSWNFWSDMPDGYKQYGMPVLVGDQVKDAEQLKATSPLLQAARIKQPLLLAYGTADMRVPLPHGTKFYQAVKQTNPNVEFITYDEEGHGWKLPKNRIDFWSRVEKFLDKNIGAQ